ncbi:unnamed protein product, partial [Adineta ricciae]
LSFNQPKLCPTAKWNTAESQFAIRKTDNFRSPILFIDKKSTIYAHTGEDGEILVWSKDSARPTSVISYQSEFTPTSLYVSDNGNIYLSTVHQGILKWIASNNSFVRFMDTADICYQFFIDLSNNFYCSVWYKNRVEKISQNENGTVKTTIVAGTGSSGSGENQLHSPKGIFVDTNFDLYVADSGNHRIQLFQFGEGKGKTVAGEFSFEITILLHSPYSVALDSERYLFIVDSGFDRIIGSGPNGFRCLLGCNQKKVQFSQLEQPSLFHFDVNGNLFVYDRDDTRIQKFYLEKDSCGNVPSIIQANYSSTLTHSHEMFSRRLNDFNPAYYYETIQVTISKNDFYILTGNSSIELYGFVYKDHFPRFDLPKNLIASYGKPDNKDQFKFTLELQMNTKYILVVTTYYPNVTGPFSVTIFGSNRVDLQRIEDDKPCHINRDIITVQLMTNTRYILVVTTCTTSDPVDFYVDVFGRGDVSFKRVDSSPVFYVKYPSNLTNNSQRYPKDCNYLDYYYYETIRITASRDGYYAFSTDEHETTDAFMYENQFDPLNSREKQLTSIRHHECWDASRLDFTAKIQANTMYILVITTHKPLTPTNFSILIYGSENFTFERFIDNSTYCYIGGPCNTEVKSIGLTLDDILRPTVNKNMTINDQSFGIKMSAAITIIMFVTGIINCICSIITFQNETLRKVGCGLYLLASSIISFLTITMFTIKFWFVLLTQMNIYTHLSIHRGGCKSIETLLKLFFYWDAWLNACVAIERGFNVYKGVNFNKEKSKRYARWILLFLPFVIMVSIIHEPIYRQVVDYKRKEKKRYHELYDNSEEFLISRDIWCQTSYSQSVRDYNTFILLVHLLGPFIANLVSALFIIIGSARRRTDAREQQTFQEHIREQWKEHKHLVISPTILFVLTTPRLVISLLPTCFEIFDYKWLYLSAYFISFLPSILIFIIFVIPSTLYRNTFKESIVRICGKQRLSIAL